MSGVVGADSVVVLNCLCALRICWSNIVGIVVVLFLFFQAEDGIRDLVRSRGLGDVYKRQERVGGVPIVRKFLLTEPRTGKRLNENRFGVLDAQHCFAINLETQWLSLIHI